MIGCSFTISFPIYFDGVLLPSLSLRWSILVRRILTFSRRPTGHYLSSPDSIRGTTLNCEFLFNYDSSGKSSRKGRKTNEKRGVHSLCTRWGSVGQNTSDDLIVSSHSLQSNTRFPGST